MIKKITSKSMLPKGVKFDINLFKKPFCSNELIRFKRFETVNFKSKFFLSKKDPFKKTNQVLIVSGPARNGNHMILSLLDGHPQIQCLPGEDSFLRESFSKAKINETRLIKKFKNLKNTNFITNMSGAYFNKWKAIDKLNKMKNFVYNKKEIKWIKNYNKEVLNTWSGVQPGHEISTLDFQNFVPKILYSKYEGYLKKNLIKIKNSKSFLEVFKIYLEAISRLVERKEKIKFKNIYINSGIRRELFYLLKKSKNIICICPIRRFESFYHSFGEARFKYEKNKQKKLNELWEHWRHKTIDYLLLKKKYPNQVIMIKFEDIIKKNKNISKKLCKKLKINYSNSFKKATIAGVPVKGNSSFGKSDKLKGKFFHESIRKKFPKKLLPKEYFDILKEVDKVCL